MTALEYRRRLTNELHKALSRARVDVQRAIDGDGERSGELNGVGWGELSAYADGLEKALKIANSIRLRSVAKT